eukprot:1449698-Rhodomonas_salina.1
MSVITYLKTISQLLTNQATDCYSGRRQQTWQVSIGGVRKRKLAGFTSCDPLGARGISFCLAQVRS